MGVRVLAVSLLFCAAAGIPLRAQQDAGAATLTGTVLDQSGKAIQGATVKATQGDRILMTLTDDSGAFHFDRMTPGSWIVEVDMFGFEHARSVGLRRHA